MGQWLLFGLVVGYLQGWIVQMMSRCRSDFRQVTQRIRKDRTIYANHFTIRHAKTQTPEFAKLACFRLCATGLAKDPAGPRNCVTRVT